MTEIPEHLLKRSKERRSAIGGDDAPAPDAGASSASQPAADAPAASTPAVPAATAVTPAPSAPAPAPEPVRPEVAAFQRRRKIPFWALPVLAGLPLWAYVYQATLEPPPAGEDDPLTLGAGVYSSCAGCHGASGGGVSAPALNDVLETFPDYRDHLLWVKLGDEAYPGTYGANGKPNTPAVMPSFGATLDEQEIAEVVLYERVQFGGLDPASEEYLELVEIAEGNKTFEEAGMGPLSEAAGISPDELAAG